MLRTLKINNLPWRTLQHSHSRYFHGITALGRDGGYYNDEQKEMQRSVRKIIETHIDPYIEEWEKDKRFPIKKLYKILGSAGFLGINKPVEYGGMGLDYKYQLAVGEEIASIRAPGITLSLGVQAEISTPALAVFGSDYLKREFLAPSIAGDLVSCLGVSESAAGSDVSKIQTNARFVGDDIIINGEKMWITNALQADWVCLLANTKDGHPHRNKSLICVPMDTPGIHLGKPIDKMGMHSSDTGQIFFEDVRVPAKNIIGDNGMGFVYQMMQFQQERLGMTALSLTPCDICIEETVKYTKDRNVFGKPVLDNQIVHFRLAELQTEVECLRSLLYRAVDLMVSGDDVTRLASMCKLKGGRLCREVTDACLQYWGGMGFTDEVLVSRFYRDLRLNSIGGGADEVMLSIIAKFMGTLPGRMF